MATGLAGGSEEAIGAYKACCEVGLFPHAPWIYRKSMGRKGRVRQNESDLDTILLQDFNKFLLLISCYDPVVLLAFLVNWIMPRTNTFCDFSIP